MYNPCCRTGRRTTSRCAASAGSSCAGAADSEAATAARGALGSVDAGDIRDRHSRGSEIAWPALRLRGFEYSAKAAGEAFEGSQTDLPPRHRLGAGWFARENPRDHAPRIPPKGILFREPPDIGGLGFRAPKGAPRGRAKTRAAGWRYACRSDSAIRRVRAKLGACSISPASIHTFKECPRGSRLAVRS